VPDPRVEAAGGVLWRGDPAAPEVAVIHRPRYDDWSLPKGKLAPGEHPLLGGLREITEETGFGARPGRRLGSLRYVVVDGPKRVRYWACEALDGRFRATREVDELRWLGVADARELLSPTHDRAVLDRYAADTRRTRALVVVRHASAGDKKSWTGSDAARPLDALGRSRAVVVAGLLRAYGVRRVASADVLRCRETVEPFTQRLGIPVDVRPETTAGVFDNDPAAGVDAVAALLEQPGSAAWCGQREVIPDLVAAVAGRLGCDTAPDEVRGLRKGALLLLHVADQDGSLVALERLAG
jgi:8-oxo-dGTP diphosphatase